MTNSEDIEGQRETRKRLLAERSIEGWFLETLVDGIDENGEWIYWHEWKHHDGREASVWPDGHCSDPELAELLRAQAKGMPVERPPWLLMAAVAVFRWLRTARGKQ